MSVDQRRNFYRIEYHNPSDCPQAKISGKSFEVRDLSEKAVRIHTGSTSGFTKGLTVSGAMHFTDGESFLVSGEVLSVRGSDVVIQFKKGFPLRKIMEEQRRLIQKTKGS